MKMLFYFLLALCIPSTNAWSQIAQSGCSTDVVLSVAKNIGVHGAAVGDGSVTAAACERAAYDQKIRLSAFAFDTGEENEKTFVVAIVDASRGKVLNSYKRKVKDETLVEFGPNSLRIDTAPYQLASDLRAFGVRFNSASIGPSCPEAVWSDELTIFAPYKDGLRPVLQGLAMRKLQALNGCISNDYEKLIVQEAKLTLVVAKTSSNGFNDLTVTARITGGGASDQSAGNRTEHYTLRYNGDTYQGIGTSPWWYTISPLGE